MFFPSLFPSFSRFCCFFLIFWNENTLNPHEHRYISLDQTGSWQNQDIPWQMVCNFCSFRIIFTVFMWPIFLFLVMRSRIKTERHITENSESIKGQTIPVTDIFGAMEYIVNGKASPVDWFNLAGDWAFRWKMVERCKAHLSVCVCVSVPVCASACVCERQLIR